MSIKAAIQFLRKMQKDRKFKEKFAAAKSAEGKLKVAKAAGFSFTVAELKEAREKLLSELTARQMDQVAGGGRRPGCASGAGDDQGCAVGNSAGWSCAQGNSDLNSCTSGSGVSRGGVCSAGSTGQKPAACSFGSGDWGSNSAEMATEGIEEVVELAEL